MKEYPDLLLNFEEDCSAITLKDNIIALKNNAYPHWVRLSYVGHISDYHGYKRKYEHIFPLNYGPIDDIRGQIGRALVVNKGMKGEESDEEVIQDNEEYDKAV